MRECSAASEVVAPSKVAASVALNLTLTFASSQLLDTALMAVVMMLQSRPRLSQQMVEVIAAAAASSSFRAAAARPL